MSKESDGSSPSQGNALSAILDPLRNFDWLKIPGAVRAISMLLVGTAETGTAWLDVLKAKGEQKAEAIRNTTEVRKAALEELLAPAIKLARSDSELMRRAVQHMIADQFEKQKSREAVAAETIELLQEASPPPETPPPDDDWLRVYAGYAEKATTDRMRKHWAAILAGEVRAPGSFSLSALHLFSVMDQKLAETIAEVRAWIVNDDHVPLVASLRKGENFTKLMLLDSVGFLRLNVSKYFPPMPDLVYYSIGDKMVHVQTDREIEIHAAVLTFAGQEVLKIVPLRRDDLVAREYAALWVEQGAKVGRVS